MRQIVVGGGWSSCGKTSVVELLLKALPGWSAIKVTPSRPDEICPLGTCCGACAAPEGPFEVITDPAVLAQTGKDTARYLAAGAAQVAWVRALPEALPAAMQAATEGFAPSPGVIVESTTLIPGSTGFRILVAASGRRDLKESALRCAGAIDLLAINRMEPGADGSDHSLRAALAPHAVLALRAVAPVDDPANTAFVAFCRAHAAEERRPA